MRILIPVLGFARAGGYRVLSELANAWLRAGHEVSFVAPATSGQPYFPTQASIHWVDEDGRNVDSPHGKGETGLGNLRALFAGIRRLHHDFDVVLANHSLTTWPTVLARVPRGKRFYYIQAYEPEYYVLERRPLLWLLSRLSYALPLTQIANASIYRHALVRPFAIVPFGIDLSLFRPKLSSQRQPSEPLIIGTIGRSEPQKGALYVLKAFEELYASDPRHRLRIAYGNLPAGWSHPAAEIVVPSNDAELAEFYRSIDVLVAAGTVQHGAPHYPALEALASGAALVTTGFEPATSENAWIVPNRDATAIAEAIREISTRPDAASRRSNSGYEAVQAFGWDVVSAKMLDVFAKDRENAGLDPRSEKTQKENRS
ncbi:glycosyltransferase family 4 protein [Qipengyuania pelagi]|nr:glycosyltransferase family 4 protein [Qipengyuania pelagi]